MANLTIVAANVVKGDTAQTKDGIAGATITAGQVVFLNPTTKRWGLADNNSVTASERAAVGIALNSSSTGQPLEVQVAGTVNLGATLVVGTTYYLSDIPGAIAPAADLTTGEYVTIIGVAVSASMLAMDLGNYPVAIP